MIKIINDWYKQHFSNPQVATLAILIIIGFSVILFAGHILKPILAAIVLAYLLDGGIEWLRQIKMPRMLAVLIVFSLFLLSITLLLFVLAPTLLKQASQFVVAVPSMISTGQQALMLLPEKYPNIISEQVVIEILSSLRTHVTQFSQQILSFSISSVFDLIAFMVYLVVVPLLVFFFLKDRDLILDWFGGFLPSDHSLVTNVWKELHIKIAGYVRGKFLEILIVWVITFITFLFFGLEYSMLLSFLVGISVLIPFVGAVVVTIPVVAVAYFQWGYNNDFIYVMIAFAVIQFLDGNLIVPLLFSEMVNLHPAAIIVAVLFFGAIWGIWGIFFAIPLATLIHAVINAWPATGVYEDTSV